MDRPLLAHRSEALLPARPVRHLLTATAVTATLFAAACGSGNGDLTDVPARDRRLDVSTGSPEMQPDEPSDEPDAGADAETDLAGDVAAEPPADVAEDVPADVVTDPPVDLTPDAPDAPDLNAGPFNVVFVTSTSQTPEEVDGTSGADEICRTRAEAAGLTGTFVAWLSSSTESAIGRLGAARGFVRLDGLPFADTTADIAAGILYYPLRIDELGNDVAAEASQFEPYAITGTQPSGEPGATCGDWMLFTDMAFQFPGAVSGGARFWTGAVSATCTVPGHLYCFQIDHQSPLSPPAAEGRIAFVSNTPFTPEAGIEAADELCASDAKAASLAGTYRALMAQPGLTAASRFDANGPAWVRLDGVRVAATSDDLLAGRWLAPIDLTATGTRLAARVWTGAAAPHLAGSNASTCEGWTGGTEDGTLGYAGLSNRGAFDVQQDACTVGARLYCLQDD